MLKLRPGILVGCSSSIQGGVSYRREELDHRRDGAADESSWRTDRRIEDVADHEAAKTARIAARNRIVRECIQTPFGWVCVKGESVLSEALAEARAIVEAHNAVTTCSPVRLSVLPARVMGDEAESLEAVRGELEGLTALLERACEARDAAAISDVASRAKRLGSLLDEGSGLWSAPSTPRGKAGGKLGEAIAAAQSIARDIRKAVKGGAEAATARISASKLAVVSRGRAALVEVLAEPDAPRAGGAVARGCATGDRVAVSHSVAWRGA